MTKMLQIEKTEQFSSFFEKQLEKYVKSSENDGNKFCGDTVPKISLHKYIKRVMRYIKMYYELDDDIINVNVNETLSTILIVTLIYIERLSECIDIYNRNIHRIFATSVMLSCKYLEDVHPPNDYFSKLTGLSLKEINYFEITFCNYLKFKFEVNISEFQKYKELILNPINLIPIMKVDLRMSLMDIIVVNDNKEPEPTPPSTPLPISSFSKKLFTPLKTKKTHIKKQKKTKKTFLFSCFHSPVLNSY